MGKTTSIAWTDHTFNIAWGCTEISPGCANCYARDLAKRMGFDIWGKDKPRRTFGAKHWAEPLAWDRQARLAGKRARVFCSSMCDIFEDHPTITAELAKLWPLIRATPNLDWQLLTKRAERIADCLPADWGNGYPNVWLGVTVENDDEAWRVNDHLAHIPAMVRFVSYEPALGLVPSLDLSGIHWLIFGGETGPRHRQHDIVWARIMRDRCLYAGVAFFFKQSSGRLPGTGTLLDGVAHRAFPCQIARPQDAFCFDDHV